MVGRRKRPDGLPARLYMRAGKRVTVFFLKGEDNRNTELARAFTADSDAVRRARARAIELYGRREGAAIENVAWLIDQYFTWQEALPSDDTRKKAASTIAENRREAANLKAFFGRMAPAYVEPHHCYAYIDERAQASGAAVKAGKEITLLSTVFEYGRRRGKLRDNPVTGVQKPRNAPSTVLVTWEQVELLCEVGKAAGGAYAIMGLAAQFAWLTLRRSNEVRNFTRDRISPAGCLFTAGKQRAGYAKKVGLIEWSPLLRATVDQALAVKRWGDNSLPARYVFGTLAGTPYTKGGWKANWTRLHDKAEEEAKRIGMPWHRFSLQDCRPGGVTEKAGRGDADTTDATLHADGRMVATVYDRRRLRRAKPAL